MKLLLTVPERLQLLNLLPSEGRLDLLRQTRKAQEILGFDDGEIAILKLKQEGAQVTWTNPQVAPKKDREQLDRLVTLGIEKELPVPIVAHFIERLTALEKEGKLALVLLSVYEKLVTDDSAKG